MKTIREKRITPHTSIITLYSIFQNNKHILTYDESTNKVSSYNMHTLASSNQAYYPEEQVLSLEVDKFNNIWLQGTSSIQVRSKDRPFHKIPLETSDTSLCLNKRKDSVCVSYVHDSIYHIHIYRCRPSSIHLVYRYTIPFIYSYTHVSSCRLYPDRYYINTILDQTHRILFLDSRAMGGRSHVTVDVPVHSLCFSRGVVPISVVFLNEDKGFLVQYSDNRYSLYRFPSLECIVSCGEVGGSIVQIDRVNEKKNLFFSYDILSHHIYWFMVDIDTVAKHMRELKEAGHKGESDLMKMVDVKAKKKMSLKRFDGFKFAGNEVVMLSEQWDCWLFYFS